MRNNKRIGSLVLAMLLVVSMVGSTLSVGVVGASGPVLSADNKTVTTGEQFVITVTLENAGSVYGGNFTLQYDSDMLTVDSYSFGSIVSGHTKNCNLNYQSAGNLIRVTFSGAEAVGGDGTLVTFTFTAKAAGMATLQFNANKMYDENGSVITTIANGSAVTITEKTVPAPVIAIADQTVTVGQTVSVPVVISNAAAVYGGNFTLQYDSDMLTVDSYSFGSIVSGHTKNCNLNYQSAGNLIRVTFSGADAVSGDGTLVNFTFTAKAAGTATLQINTYKLYDENGSAITATANGSAVTITEKAVPAPVISITDQSVTVGQTVYVPVVISNAAAVYGGNFTLQYDSDMLTVDSYSFGSIVSGHTKNCNLNYQSAGNLIRVTFSGAEAVSGNGTLVTFTFTAKAAGAATLQFNSYKMYDENGSAINTTATGCVVTVNVPSIVAMSVQQMPDRDMYFIGDTFDITGLVLRVDYSDGKAFFVSDGFAVSGFSSTTAGIKTITASYEGFSAEFSVTVLTPSVSFEFCNANDYIELCLGGTVPVLVTTKPEGQVVTLSASHPEYLSVDENTLTAKAFSTEEMTIEAAFIYNGIRYCNEIPVTISRYVSGSAGENCAYRLDLLTGEFSITGSGAMLDYADFGQSPWNGYVEYIRSIYIHDGITSIGDYAFVNCVNATELRLPNTVNMIGTWAFEDCWSIETLTIPASVEVISDHAFGWCGGLKDVYIYNADVLIGEDALNCQYRSMRIHGYKGSTAETHATQYGREFVAFKPISVEISKLPMKVNYYQGDRLDTQGLELKVTYDTGKIETITYGFTTSADDYSFGAIGTYTIQVYYQDLITGFEITVFETKAVLSKESLSLTVGDTTELSVVHYPSEEDCLSGMRWYVSNTDVVTIQNGVVTAVGVGTAEVRFVFTYNGFGVESNPCYITVWEPSICLSETDKSIVIGEVITLTALTNPSGQVVAWTSSDTTVATVEDGHVTAVTSGVVTITASFTYKGIVYSKACTVTVVCHHTIQREIPFKNATCTETGNNHYHICNICNAVLKEDGITETNVDAEVIPATGHSYNIAVIAPNCTEIGYTTYTCACGDSYVADEVVALGHSYETVIAEATCTEDGAITNTCATCGDTQVEVIPATGHQIEKGICVNCGWRTGVTLSGIITSFGTVDGAVTVRLMQSDAEVANVISTNGAYCLEAVAPGHYTLEVSKQNHVTREYQLTVDKQNVTQDIKICLIGDIDGNGKINVGDVAKMYAHVKKTSLITDEYILKCLDVTGEGKINVGDTARLYAHVKKTSELW